MGHLTELLREASALQGRTLCGRWRVERLLGGGASAAVFEAIHRRNGKRAALKVLHPELASNLRLKKRFLREGYLANRVDHPGAVSVLDDDETEDGILFLVMEFLEGHTVGQRARQNGGRLPLAEAIRVADGILDVLEAAHAKQIVHRDIKPDNVFLTTSGEVRVLDFGLARWTDDKGALLTRSEASLGTPAFMAPEQARGERHAIDHRSDLWSVGATLYFLLSGRFVHDSDDRSQLVFSAATEAASPLAHVMPGVPPELAAVIDRALELDQRARFQNASEMRGALRRAFEPSSTAEVSPSSRAATGDSSDVMTASETDAAPSRQRRRAVRVRTRRVLGFAFAGALAFAAWPLWGARRAFVRAGAEATPSAHPAVPLLLPAVVAPAPLLVPVAAPVLVPVSSEPPAARPKSRATRRPLSPAPLRGAAPIEVEPDELRGELSDDLLDLQK